MQALACGHSTAEVIWAAGPHIAMARASLLRLLAAVAAAAVLLCCGADAVSMHTVFTTECRPYFTWQSLGARAVCLCLQALRNLAQYLFAGGDGAVAFLIAAGTLFLGAAVKRCRAQGSGQEVDKLTREGGASWLAGRLSCLAISAPGQTRRAS